MTLGLVARRAALALASALFVALPLAGASCGGRVEDETDNPTAGSAGVAPDGGVLPKDGGLGGKDGGKPPPKDAGKDAQLDASTDAKDALPDYVDPGCPDAGPPQTDYQCDPYGHNGDECGQGKSCYPFVTYPTDPCGQEVYGAQCIFAGTSGQGDPCGIGCQAQHICVISGQGTQCVKLCDLNDPSPCEDGLVCQPVDIPGIGGCL